MKPALFLDRDGTINKDEGYTYKIEDLRIYPEVPALIIDHNDKGHLVIVVTNQSGINRGHFTEKDMHAFNVAIKERLAKEGARIDAFYFCPHMPEENCSCRKPKTGMVEQAMRDFDIDLKHSMMIGDNDAADGEMARTLGIDYTIVKR